MEHILTECESPERETIHTTIEKLWKRKQTKVEWPGWSHGAALGCGLVNFRDKKGRKMPELDRFYRIIRSEADHLTWTLRCARRIDNKDDPDKYPTEDEVKSKLAAALNKRLQIDMILTNVYKFEKNALSTKVVLSTWKGALLDENKLPENWLKADGVLVGIRPRRPRGRNR
jgi:hypothetical protein